ncbi:MAG: EpsG family protein [Candidatus Cloacimonetes bacterium]|nr:EpsG family protein [Candidatus Cloacimonadota bacterium]
MYHVIGFFILILLVFSIFYDKLKNDQPLLFFIIFGLFVFTSIRYNIGTDYPTYYDCFNNIKAFSFSPDYSTGYIHYEPLFRYIVAILKNVFISPIFYFSLFAFISLAFVWSGIKQLSDNYILSTFIFYTIFYINYLFNGINQGVTMCVFLFSLKYIIDNNFKAILIISLTTTLFHTTGILILLAYFLSKLKLNKYVYISIILISILLAKFNIGEIIFNKLITFLPGSIQMLVTSSYLERHAGSLSITSILQRVIVVFPLLFYSSRLSTDKRFNVLFPIYCWSLVFYFLFGFVGLFITRINMFFRMSEIILIPILYEKLSNKYSKIIALLIIAIWGFTMLSWFYFKEAYYPFKTIFEAGAWIN